MAKDRVINAGNFCWGELYAKDINKLSKFYTSLFGWEIESISLPENEPYYIFKTHNVGISGGIQLNKEMGNLRPHWNSYVLVNDIHESVTAAKKLGARVMKDVINVLNKGKMAVILDPTDAAFSLWEAMDANEQSSLTQSMPGNIGWNELVTNDTDKSGQFYTDLFKWTVSCQEWLPGETYTTFLNADGPVAGMRRPTEKLNTAGPRWWLYFTVSNLKEHMAKAEEMGGHVGHDPITIPGIGRFAMIRDPDGVCFSIIERD